MLLAEVGAHGKIKEKQTKWNLKYGARMTLDLPERELIQTELYRKV